MSKLLKTNCTQCPFEIPTEISFPSVTSKRARDFRSSSNIAQYLKCSFDLMKNKLLSLGRSFPMYIKPVFTSSNGSSTTLMGMTIGVVLSSQIFFWNAGTSLFPTIFSCKWFFSWTNDGNLRSHNLHLKMFCMDSRFGQFIFVGCFLSVNHFKGPCWDVCSFMKFFQSAATCKT